MKKLTLIFLFIFPVSTISAEKIKLRVLGPQSDEDISQSYYYDLLDAALNQSENNKYSLEIIDARELTQGRTLHLLSGDFLDVFWMGTSIERERQFLPIKIPLLKGLLGYRVSIINETSRKSFEKISPSSLQNKLACQGQHWPDTRILEYNGFTVLPVGKYKAMFEMINKGRCDYFPRAIFEGYGELEKAKINFPTLAIYDDTILYYPFPIYFFVKRQNKELKNQIEQGLESLIDSGKFESLLINHPVTKHLYPLGKWKDKRFIRLNNPFLSENTDIDNHRYWVDL